MNIKDKLLLSVREWRPGGAIDAPIRDKFVPALFCPHLLERNSMSGRFTTFARRFSCFSDEEARWRTLFREAVDCCNEEEIGEFIGAQGEAFYRFRAELQEGEEFFHLQLFKCGPAEAAKGDRRAVLEHSILDKSEGKGDPDVLREMVGGKGRPAKLNDLLERVLPSYPDQSLQNALPLDGEIQELIAKRDREGLLAVCSRLTHLDDELLLFGKIPRVNPSFTSSQGEFTQFLTDDSEMKGLMEKGSEQLKEALLASGAIPVIRNAIAMRVEIQQKLLSDDKLPWWEQLFKSPVQFGEEHMKAMAKQFVEDTVADITKAVDVYLEEELKTELLTLLENDEQFCEALAKKMGGIVSSYLLPMRETILDRLVDVSESLPPILGQVLELLGRGSLGRREQPFWMEILPENGKFTVNLYLAGRGVFRFEQVERERLNQDFFFRFFAYQAHAEWQGDIYDTGDVLAGLTACLGTTPGAEESHTFSGQWGVLQEYGMKRDEATQYRLKFEAYCDLFLQKSSETELLEQTARQLMEEAVALKKRERIDLSALKTYYATLQDALWRLEEMKQKEMKQKEVEGVRQVVPEDLQAKVKNLFALVGITSFRVELVKDLMIDHLGEDARETVEHLCDVIDSEVGNIEEAPVAPLEWKKIEVKEGAWKVARLALHFFVSPLTFGVQVTIDVSYKAFKHYFPAAERQFYRFKVRLIAKAVMPLIFNEEQLKSFKSLLTGVENQLLHTTELFFSGKKTEPEAELLTLNSAGLNLEAAKGGKAESYSFVIAEESPVTAQNVVTKLKQWQMEAEEVSYYLRLVYLNEKIKQLPPASDEIWNEVTDYEACLIGVAEISKMISNPYGNTELKNQLKVHQFTLYAISDKLARRHPATQLNGFQVNAWGFISWYQHLEMRLLDTSLVQRFEENCRYFSIDPTISYSDEEIVSKSKRCLFSLPQQEFAKDSFDPAYLEGTIDAVYLKKVWDNPAVQERLKQYGVNGTTPLTDQLAILFANPTPDVDNSQKDNFIKLVLSYTSLVKEFEHPFFSENQWVGAKGELQKGLTYLQQNKDSLLEEIEKRQGTRYHGMLPLPDHLLRMVHEMSCRSLETDLSPVRSVFESTIKFKGWDNGNETLHAAVTLFQPVFGAKISRKWGRSVKLSGKFSNAVYHPFSFQISSSQYCRAICRQPQYQILNDKRKHFDWIKGAASEKLAEAIFSDLTDAPVRALAYFAENPYELKFEKNVALLELSLLHSNALRSQLTTHPEFFQTLKQFYNKTFSYMVREGNFEDSYNLLRIGLMVQLEIETLGGFEPLFDFSKALMQVQNLGTDQKNFKLGYLVGLKHSLKDPVQLSADARKEVARELLMAHLKYISKIEKKDFGYNEYTHLWDCTYARWSPYIKQSLNEDRAFQEEMLESFCVFHNLTIASGEDLAWEGNYPSYRKGNLWINLESGTTNVDKSEWKQKIWEKLGPAFPLVLGSLDEKEGGVFHIPQLGIDVETDAIRGQCRFYQQIEGKRFRWIEVSGKEESISYWLEEGGNHLLQFDKGKLTQRYRVKSDEEFKDQSIEIEARLKYFKGEWLEERPIEAFKEGLAPLARFCPLSDMRVFVSGDQLKLIEFANLQFEIEGERAVCLNNFSGYSLAKRQKVDALASFSDYLVLQNGEKRKILLPKKSLVQALTSRLLKVAGFHSSSQLLNSFTLPGYSEDGFYTYDLVAGKLTSSEPGALAHLVAFYLVKGEYADAEAALKKLNSIAGIEPLGSAVHVLTEKVAMAAALFQEPQATEISLKLSALAYENQTSLFPAKGHHYGPFYALILQKNYLHYLELGVSHLTHFQELFLIDLMESENQQISNEVNEQWKYNLENFCALFLHPKILERAKELQQKYAPQVWAIQPLWKRMAHQMLSSGGKGSDLINNVMSLMQMFGRFTKNQISVENLKKCLAHSLPKRVAEVPTAFHQLTPQFICEHFLSYYALLETDTDASREFIASLKLMKGYRGAHLPVLELLSIMGENPKEFPPVADVERELQRVEVKVKPVEKPTFHAEESPAKHLLRNKISYLQGKKRELYQLEEDFKKIVNEGPLLTALQQTIYTVEQAEDIEHEKDKLISPGQMYYPTANNTVVQPEEKQLAKIVEVCTSETRRSQLMKVGIEAIKGVGFSSLGLGQAYLWWQVGQIGSNLYTAYQESGTEEYCPKKASFQRPMPAWSEQLQQEDDQIGAMLNHLADALFQMNEERSSPPFHLENSDPVATAYTAALNQSLQDYEQRPKGVQFLGKVTVDALYQLGSELKREINDLARALGEEKEALVAYVNSKESNDLSLEGNRTKLEKIDFGTLLRLYLHNDTAQVMAKTALNGEEVEQVFMRLTRYLVWETRRQQMLRILNKVNQAHQMPRNTVEYALEVRGIAEGLAAKRAYKVNGPIDRLTRAYLIFESKTDKMLWEKQVSQQEKMLLAEEKRKVVELIMGSGKTSFGIPITDYFAADGSQLVINIFTKPLAKTNIADIGQQAALLFDQLAYTMQFSRNQVLSNKTLKARLLSILRVIKEQGQLNMCKEDLQALELVWLETLYKKESGDHLTLMTEILRIIRTYAKPNFDEAHEILKRDSQLNHPLGPKKHLDKDYIRVTEEYVRALLTLDESVGLRKNQQAYLGEEGYEKKVQPEVTKKLFGSKIMAEATDALKGLATGLLEKLGPKSLTKIVNVNYGPSKAGNGSYAKPYRGNNSCVEEANIQSQYEACLKSFFQQIVNRMTPAQSKQLVQRMIKRAEHEKRTLKVEFEKTPTARLFTKWCGEGYALKECGDVDVSSLLNQHDEAVLLHARLFVAPEITYYTLSLSSNSQNFASMFPSYYADTGTPDNHETYPVGTKVLFDEGTMGESIDLLKKLCSSPASIEVVKSSTPAESLSEILRLMKPGKTRAIIDCGALWRGISSEAVAEALEKQVDGTVESLVYYREDQKLMEKNLKSGKLDGFQKVAETEKSRFAYFDHTHIFGADIPLSPDAEGILTIGEDITLTQLAQAMWRLRGLKKLKQTLRIVMSEKTKELIGGCTIDKILQFAVRNQAKKMVEDNYLADKQKIADLIRRSVLDKLLESKDHKEQFQIFEEFQNVILTSMEDDPYILYGLPKKPMAPQEVLEAMKKTQFAILEQNSRFSEEEKQALLDELAKIGHGNYPKTVLVSLRGDQVDVHLDDAFGQELLITQNQEQQNELNEETDLEQSQVLPSKPDITRFQHLPNKEWDPSTDYFASSRWLSSHQKLSKTLAHAELPLLAKHAAHFAGPIYCTENFISRKKGWFSETPCTPFTEQQKPIQEVLIVEENVLLIDQVEARFWREQLAKDRNSTQPSRVKIALFDVTLNAVVSTGKNRLTELSEETRSHLARLKFLKGAVSYEEKELRILEKWLKDTGPEKMKDLFTEINERFGQRALLGSNLDVLFEELST